MFENSPCILCTFLFQIQDVSSEVNVDKDKTTCQPNHREEIPYANIEDTNSIIASVENRLQQLKNATIPNREKALELITIYDKLSDQEQQIVKNNPGMVLPSQEGVEECYQILKETNVLLDSVYDRLQRLKNNTQITHDEKTMELKDINYQLIQQEQLIKSKSIIGGYNNGNVAKDVENGHSLLNTVTLIGVVDETSVDDDCVMLVCEDDDVRSNETPVTECDNQQKMIDEDEDIHLRFSPADDLVAVEVPNPEAMEIASIEIVPSCPLNKKVNTSLEDPSTENKEELDSYSPNETLVENTNTAITQPAENTEMTINDYEDEDLESSLALEISPMEKEIIDDFSVTRMAEEYKEYEDDSPPYENIVPSKESETEYRQKSPTLTNRKERPRLRSDNAQYMDDVSLTVSQDSDITSTELKVKAYKPRRLKIPKSGGRTKDKTSPKDKVNEEKPPVALTNSNTQDGSAEPKVIMSMRYNKRAKLKMQTVTQGKNLTENCTTDESVESMMSALYAEEGEIVNSLKNDESRQSLCSSHDPLNITISTDPLDVNTSAVTTKTRSKLQRNKVISLKIAAGLSKNKRLKSRNITVTKSTVRRRVSFETPDNTVTTNITSNHPTESAADIVNKCHRGKPYVALTKLKPNFLKTLRKQREHDSSSNTSYTTITTTCNITNSTSSGSSKNTTTTCTTTSTSPAASFGSNNNCLCDGTFHVLGQKRSCLTNNNNADDEEDDYACDLGTQHKLLKLDSVNILDKNSMEFETTDDNTTTQRITYHKNIVFEGKRWFKF